ncbi:hypothetical protein RYX36_015872 [Vicia faba]
MASCPIASNETERESIALPNWLELPRDITVNILQRLATIEIVTSVRFVCPMWWYMFKDPLMWRNINMTEFSFITYFDPTKICHYAIKQSCGHLEDVIIQYFGTDDLLEFIADNASKLRSLRLGNCHRISDKGFSEAVKKLPLLESLDISWCNLSKDSLEVVGQYCPLLTVLKFRRLVFEYTPHVSDDEAFVIAKNMFGLRHLYMERSKLSSAGLIAILDGCPRLESLDLLGCYNLYLNESLKKKCLDRIKNL